MFFKIIANKWLKQSKLHKKLEALRSIDWNTIYELERTYWHLKSPWGTYWQDSIGEILNIPHRVTTMLSSSRIWVGLAATAQAQHGLWSNLTTNYFIRFQFYLWIRQVNGIKLKYIRNSGSNIVLSLRGGTEYGEKKIEHWWTKFKIIMNTIPVFSAIELLSVGNV